MSGVYGAGETTRREHAEDRAAKRILNVDPFGGVITEGNFTMRIDKSHTPYVYIGITQVGGYNDTDKAVWQIKRITRGVGDVVWANGTDEFNQIWDDRLTITNYL